ncbi:DUF3570 domain-containing protein [Flavihumibacter sp. UBA7668]|uniref:DUF3570 domain-containing protein n=1 Tax=Flavihumibacter sp. UBA7668 TaxID=1946542 RepID=UPI0025B9B116|nr:DUF3570 domain-containing protein [Flavihumibacter sp. UBA7668]
MKKICLTVVGLYIGLFAAFSQSNTDSSYRSRKLKIEEINLVSSYYHQEGDHAAVTGGIGSQKLTDFSNSLEVKLIRYDRANRKQTWSADIGLDHYTSASSDKIDPKSVSSASYADTRIYPSFSFSRENEKKGTEWGAGLSYSGEYDYTSIGASIHGSKKTANKMGELTVKGQVYLDQISLIYPIELRDGNSTDPLKRGGDSRNSYSLAMSWSQIINQRFQLAFLLDLVQQQGYLSLPFNRVYFTDGTVHVERLPDSRFKVPLGFRANYFAGDRLVLRSYYRYYFDNWGLTAHTASLETSVKISPFFSVSPFYRFYQQTGVDYFEPYLTHTPGKDFYTSNFDLSKFTSHFFGSGIRLAPPKGVFGIQHFNSLELRYGHYSRSNTLQSNIVSVHLKWK